MRTIRKSNERGLAEHGWLNSRHTFSFAGYHDPRHMGFSVLRVINEDRVAPGQGFGTHGHRDMEILSYVLEGELAHEDSMGNGSAIFPGDVQRMSAGTGVQHSERNPSAAAPVHFLQIWILPDARGIEPGYEQQHFPESARRGQLCLVASADGRAGSVRVHQDIALHAALLTGPEQLQFQVAAGRWAYVHVARGSLKVDAERLEAGDALKVTAPATLQLHQGEDAEVLLFDLPGDD